MIGLIGKKLGQTRVYDANGNAVCVTVVHAGPNRVLQVKSSEEADGYNAVQLGYDDQAKPERQPGEAVMEHSMTLDLAWYFPRTVHQRNEAGGSGQGHAILQTSRPFAET